MTNLNQKCGICKGISDGFITSCVHYFHYNCVINLLKSGDNNCPTCKKKIPLPTVVLFFLLGAELDRNLIKKCSSHEDLVDLLLLSMWSSFNLSDSFVSDLITRAIELGWNINSPYKNALIQSISWNYPAVVRELLKNDKIDVNLEVDFKIPLVEACISSNFEIIKLLIENGAEIHENVIIEACRSCDMEIINYLIETGKRKKDLMNKFLRVSCRSGRIEIFEALLLLGAEIETTSEQDAFSIFHDAALGGNVEILDRIVSMGGRLGPVPGESAIHVASRDNQVEVLERIIELGGDVNDRTFGFEGETPLHLACYFKSGATANLLIDSGANLNLKSKCGKSPLHHAYENEQREILMNPRIRGRTVKWVIDNKRVGYEFGVEDFMKLEEETLFKYVKEHFEELREEENLEKMIEALIGLNVNFKGKNESVTMLYLAVKKQDNLELIERLLKQGADPNILIGPEETTCLHLACSLGNWKIVNLLIEFGAKVDEPNNSLETPIFKACEAGHFGIFSKLLEEGVRIENYINNGDKKKSLLWAACIGGSFEIFQKIIESGFQVSAEMSLFLAACLGGSVDILNYLIECGIKGDKNDSAALNAAIEGGHLKIFERLAELGYNLNSENGNLLNAACRRKRVEIAHKLLDAQCDLDSVDEEGYTPVHWIKYWNCFEIFVHPRLWSQAWFWALENGKTDLITLIIDSGFKDFDMVDDRGRTGLHYLSNYDIVKKLIKVGAGINFQDELGQTPLHVAAIKSDLSIINLLLETKMADMNSTDKDGNTALHLSCQRGHFNGVKALSDFGADFKGMKNKEGATPLLVACKKENLEVFKYLCGLGADQNSTDNKGRSVFHYICAYGNIALLNYISNSDTKINTQAVDFEGNTGLHLACKYGKNEIIDWLSKSKLIRIKIDQPNKFGKTSLYLAVEKDQIGCVQRLIQLGAKVNVVCEKGKSPLDMARLNNNTRIMKILIESKAKSGDKIKKNSCIIS